MMFAELEEIMAKINDLLDTLETSNYYPVELGQAIATWVVLLCRDTNRICTYSDYYIALMRIMALWPVYEIHIAISCDDPSTTREIYLYMEAWKDTYSLDNQIASEDKWILDKWEHIMSFRTEVENNIKLMI